MGIERIEPSSQPQPNPSGTQSSIAWWPSSRSARLRLDPVLHLHEHSRVMVPSQIRPNRHRRRLHAGHAHCTREMAGLTSRGRARPVRRCASPAGARRRRRQAQGGRGKVDKLRDAFLSGELTERTTQDSLATRTWLPSSPPYFAGSSQPAF